jgi:beta-lactamase class A
MRGAEGAQFFRLVMMPLALAVLPIVASTAYPGAPAASAAVSHPAPALIKPAPVARAAVMTTPVQPVTTLYDPSGFDRLQAGLAGYAAQTGARVGIVLQELSGPRRASFSLGGNQTFYAASAYKLPLLMAEAQQIAAGKASRGDVLCYDPSDQEDGWFTDYNPGSCFSRQELAERAGRYSDNTAAHILVRYLGGPDALNAYARSAGMTASALWIPNTTTPNDLAAAMVNEVLGRLGGPAAQQWLYPMLTDTASENGIPAGVAAAASVVHKVGTMYGTENDTAYVSNGRISYVLSVAVSGPDEATGWSIIAQISRQVWQYEASRAAYPAPATSKSVPPLWPDRRH